MYLTSRILLIGHVQDSFSNISKMSRAIFHTYYHVYVTNDDIVIVIITTCIVYFICQKKYLAFCIACNGLREVAAGAKGELDAVRGGEEAGLGIMVRLGMDRIYDAGIKNVRLGKIGGKIAKLF